MVKYAGIFLFGVFISAVAQVLLKKSAMKKYGTVWQEYLNPLVIGAYFLLASAAILSVVAYQGIPLSMGPVLEASGYLYVTYFGVKIYKEKINNVVYSYLDANISKFKLGRYKCGLPGQNNTPSLMIGLAGIGYEFLKIYDSSLPSVLSLSLDK